MDNTHHHYHGETLSDDYIASLVEREALHRPSKDYVQRLMSSEADLALRTDALDCIYKVHSEYCFGPLSAYLSANYLDRFLSAYELPQGNDWVLQLLSMACISLAAKMEECEVPLSTDLQVPSLKYLFDGGTMQRMELLVLSTLKWRMQAVTPFSFIAHFLYKFGNDKFPSISCIDCSVKLILSTIRGIEFLEFRPSEVAAAVALVALEEDGEKEINQAAHFCSHFDKERVLKCYEMIQRKSSMNDQSYMCSSPSGVLDVVSISYTRTDEINNQASPSTKRRKLDRSP